MSLQAETPSARPPPVRPAHRGPLTRVSGEVASVCDDRADDFCFADLTRFPAPIEDAPREFYLCHEYPPAV